MKQDTAKNRVEEARVAELQFCLLCKLNRDIKLRRNYDKI